MLVRRVRRFIAEQYLIEEEEARVLVGLSGGVDSVVLLHLLLRLAYRPVAAHVNYRLRGADSEADEAGVRAYCTSLGVPLHVAACETRQHAAAHGLSLQAAARDLRYAFFADVAGTDRLRYVAVAHHLDDQAETVLLHLLRGAGPEGLAGMPARRALKPGSDVSLIRPLLGIRRGEIEAYARRQGLTWREDASNASLAYRRSVIRRAILPVLEEHFGAAADNIARSAALLRAYVADTLLPELAEHFERAASEESAGGSLHLGILAEMPGVWRGRLILEALRRWLPEAPRRAAVVAAISALIDARPGRRTALRGGTVWRERTHLRFVPATDRPASGDAVFLIAPGDALDLGPGVLQVDLLDEPPARLDTGAPRTAIADADRLVFPLRARRWKPGDRIRPLGMEGSKKVSDLLTDGKVPSHLRAETFVLLSGEEIVWVVGHRLAEAARVRPGTRRFARFTYIP